MRRMLHPHNRDVNILRDPGQFFATSHRALAYTIIAASMNSYASRDPGKRSKFGGGIDGVELT